MSVGESTTIFTYFLGNFEQRIELASYHLPSVLIVFRCGDFFFLLHSTFFSCDFLVLQKVDIHGNSIKAAARPTSSLTSYSCFRSRTATLFLSLYLGVVLRPLFPANTPFASNGPGMPSVESRGLRDSHFDFGEFSHQRIVANSYAIFRSLSFLSLLQ